MVFYFCMCRWALSTWAQVLMQASFEFGTKLCIIMSASGKNISFEIILRLRWFVGWIWTQTNVKLPQSRDHFHSASAACKRSVDAWSIPLRRCHSQPQISPHLIQFHVLRRSPGAACRFHEVRCMNMWFVMYHIREYLYIHRLTICVGSRMSRKYAAQRRSRKNEYHRR